MLWVSFSLLSLGMPPAMQRNPLCCEVSPVQMWQGHPVDHNRISSKRMDAADECPHVRAPQLNGSAYLLEMCKHSQQTSQFRV